MKHFIVSIILVAVLFFSAQAVNALSRVGGYYRTSGKYVQPYYRTSPNTYKYDNYSSRGNYNPWTGKKGYKPW